jgi:hypothetical protein
MQMHTCDKKNELMQNENDDDLRFDETVNEDEEVHQHSVSDQDSPIELENLELYCIESEARKSPSHAHILRASA